MRKVFAIMWQHEYKCSNCHTVLVPILSERGIRGAILEGFASMTTVAILILFLPVIGISAVLCMLALIHTLGIYSSISFFAKNVHFEERTNSNVVKIGKHRSIFQRKGKNIDPAEAGEPVVGCFMCPQCRYQLSKWKALYVTRWTRYTCPKCQSRLAPVIRELERSGMLFGLIGFSCGNIIPMAVKPLYGYKGVVIVFLIVFIIVIYGATVFTHKFTHLEIVKDHLQSIDVLKKIS